MSHSADLKVDHSVPCGLRYRPLPTARTFLVNNRTSGPAIVAFLSREGWFLVAAAVVIVIGALLRIQVHSSTVVDTPVRADARDYFVAALNLKAFGIYSHSDDALRGLSEAPEKDAFRAPLYSVYLASLLNIPPKPGFERRIRLSQSILGLFIVAISIALGRRFAGRTAGIAAGLLVAIDPHLIMMENYLLTETLFTLLVLAFAGILIVADDIPEARRKLAFAGLAGVVLAMSALTRPTTLFFFALMLVFAGLWMPRWRRVVLACTAGFILAYSPWALRNASLPDGTGGHELTKAFLQHGMYPGMMYGNKPESLGIAYRFDPTSQATSESIGTVLAEIGRRFRERPLEHLQWYLFGKPAMLWSWSIIAGQGDVFVYPVISSAYLESGTAAGISRQIVKWLHLPLVLLAAAGSLYWLIATMRSPLRRDIEPGLVLMALLLAYITAMHMVGAPYPRYGIPFLPEIYILAAAFVQHLIRIFVQHPRPALPDSAVASARDGLG